VSLEASPCSPEPQEKTQRKTQRSVKSSEEGAEKQEEHQGKLGRIEDQPKMQEDHQWWGTGRKDGTHQRQHLVMSASYERSDPNNDNPYALRYSLRKHTAKKTTAGVIRRLATKTLKRNITLKGRRRLNVNQISDNRNSLSPKVRWNRGGNHKSMSTQQPHSKHEHPGKKTELEYPAQQAPGEEHQIDTPLQNLHVETASAQNEYES
jgi:hypothetical protein